LRCNPKSISTVKVAHLLRAIVIVFGTHSLLSCTSAEYSDAVAATDSRQTQIILKFRNGVDASEPEVLARLSQAAGVQVAYVRPMSAGAHVMVLPQALSAEEIEKAVDALGALQEIEYAQIDRRKKPY
jgi:hypothetical protein